MLDPQLREAILLAVQEAEQTPALAQRLVAWIEAVTAGNENIADRDATARRLEQIYEATTSDSKEGAS